MEQISLEQALKKLFDTIEIVQQGLHNENKIMLTEIMKLINESENRIIINNKYLLSEVQKYISLCICRNSITDESYGELDILCEIYGSDKGGCIPFILSSRKHTIFPHTYTGIYEKLFAPIRQTVQYVFECGIGSNNAEIPYNMGKKYEPGASLRVWRDYFPNIRTVYGADIDKDTLFSEDKIKTGYIDQTDKETIDTFFNAIDTDIEFDIMIDDGFHESTAVKCLFTNAIKRLSKNGMYIIEDVNIAYLKDIYLHVKKSGEYNIQIFHMTSEVAYDNTLLVIKHK